MLTYTLQNANDLLKTSADSSFQLWVRGFPKITYQSLSSSTNADITISLAQPSICFDTLTTPINTLVNTSFQSVSMLRRKADGTFVILLCSDYLWTSKEMIRAIAFQIGRYIGLGVSKSPSDIMYPYYTTEQPLPTTLSDQDSQNVAKLYPNTCNGWAIRRDSPQPPFYNSSNIYSLPVAFSLGSDTLYVLWPDATTRQFIFYKVLFAANPINDRWIRMSNMITVSSNDNIRQPASLYAFSLSDRGFIGAGQLFSTQSEFWEYSVKTGNFVRRASSFRTDNGIYSGAFTVSSKAYIYTIAQDKNQQSSIRAFDPSQAGDGWLPVVPIAPQTLFTQTVGFSTLDYKPCLYTGYLAYFPEAPAQQNQIIFNQSDPNEFKAPRLWGNEQSYKTFVVTNNTYLIRDNFGNPDGSITSDVWSLGFTNSTSVYTFDPRPSLTGDGRILMAIGHRNRGYVFTSTGKVYEFTP